MSSTLFDGFSPTYTTTTFDGKDAIAFAIASLLAYKRPATITEQTRHWGFSDVRTFDFKRGVDVDTQGYVAIDQRRLLVVFRGTDSFPDWLTNLQVAKDPGPWGSVHEGFQDAFWASTLLIGKTIGEMVDDKEIWIAGHSLGGALAVLLAATLVENDIDVAGLYTYGAPRVGDTTFARQLNRSLKKSANWRVVNEGDLVPHLPSELRFSHTGTRRLLTKDGVRSDDRTWDSFKKEIWGWIGLIGLVASLKIKAPHRLQGKRGYLARLNALLKDN